MYFMDTLPGKPEILDDLYKDPIQNVIEPRDFKIVKNDIEYTITPLYEYSLWGMIVTQHKSKSWMDISHANWKDYLNVKDISVIWGENIKAGDYKKVKFSHGDFTGYYSYKADVNFSNNYFSNNHLLTENEALAKEILSSRVGDQIFLKGYLVKYSHSNGQFTRSTSVERTDTGSHACETIYVQDFKILKKANQNLRNINQISKFTALGCVTAFIVTILL